MNVQELAYWLQGMLEYTDVSNLSETDAKAKLQGIKDHLAVVFNKVTPAPQKQPVDAAKIVKDAVKEATDKVKEDPADYDKLWREYIKKTPRPWEEYIPQWGHGRSWPNSYPGYPHPYDWTKGPIC